MADRRLQVFRAVAENLSFARAAEALFMTQPAVTFQVRQFEEQYGTRLFERRHGSVALTPGGRQRPGRECMMAGVLVGFSAPYPQAGLRMVVANSPEIVSRVAGYFRDKRVPPERLKTRMGLGSPEAIKAVVASGFGFAIMVRALVAREVRLRTLLAIALNPPLRRKLYLIQPEDRFRWRLVTAFVQFARQQLKGVAS